MAGAERAREAPGYEMPSHLLAPDLPGAMLGGTHPLDDLVGSRVGTVRGGVVAAIA